MLGHIYRASILAALLCASAAPAQTTQGNWSGVTAEQRALVVRHIRDQRPRSRATSPKLALRVGSVVPVDIELYWMPADALLNRFRFAVVDGHALIVDPEGRRVLELLD